MYYWLDLLREYAADVAVAFAIALVGFGLVGYLACLVVATWWEKKEGSRAKQLSDWFLEHPAQNLGLPCAAISSFAIVAVLLKAFPPEKTADGELQLKLFSMEFSGPSGPVTLWLMCFLGFVSALKLLRS